MHKSPAIEAARLFLEVVWKDEPPSEEQLLTALDRLVASFHDVPVIDASLSDSEPPGQDYQSLYQEVRSRFPDYGLYPVSDPSGSPGDEDAAMVGDAVDDLTDITQDMRAVVWFADNVGRDDAHWAFRLFFFHWGRHARELSLYLHARRFG